MRGALAAHLGSYLGVVEYIIDKHSHDVRLFLAIMASFPFPLNVRVSDALKVIRKSSIFKALCDIYDLHESLGNLLEFDENVALIDTIDKNQLDMTYFRDLLMVSFGRLIQKGVHLKTLISAAPQFILDDWLGAHLSGPEELAYILENSDVITFVDNEGELHDNGDN
ncbi:MAG: hypothetical protein KatS3mg087_1059 [Patescibacteria group bacterium]|nr:MAG: hypothetical protein KatS3mg087_1059 [Patescibacteria group bacterium]